MEGCCEHGSPYNVGKLFSSCIGGKFHLHSSMCLHELPVQSLQVAPSLHTQGSSSSAVQALDSRHLSYVPTVKVIIIIIIIIISSSSSSSSSSNCCSSSSGSSSYSCSSGSISVVLVIVVVV
jgi:hypothetical protein